MTNESTIGAPSTESGAGTQPSAEYTPSSTTDTTPAPPEQTAGPDTTGVQGTEEEDVLAGIPSLEELGKLPEDAQYKKSLLQMRTAIEENFKPKLSELTERFKPFEAVADRFTTAEEVQQIVDFKEKLFAWENDPETGVLIPATGQLADYIAQTAPETADYLAADLMNGLTRDPETGRELPRIDLALESIAQNPERRARALQILGGVEPTSLGPTWQPTSEELEIVKPEFQDIYRKLPYEEREELKLNTPDFINKYLQREKLTADTEATRQQLEAQQTQQVQMREQYVERQAQQAGDQYVESQFKDGFTGFAKSICEKWQPIKPLDPASPEAQQLGPEGIQQRNQEIQQANQTAGLLVSLAVGAMAHRDTRFMAEEFFKAIGALDDKGLQGFDSARLEFAQNARNYGYLSQKTQLGGNGQPRQDVGMLNANASRSMRQLLAQSNALAGKIMGQLDKFFVLRANSYNSTLNSGVPARPSVNGTAFNPTTAPPSGQNSPGFLSRDEINRLYG